MINRRQIIDVPVKRNVYTFSVLLTRYAFHVAQIRNTNDINFIGRLIIYTTGS